MEILLIIIYRPRLKEEKHTAPPLTPVLVDRFPYMRCKFILSWNEIENIRNNVQLKSNKPQYACLAQGDSDFEMHSEVCFICIKSPLDSSSNTKCLRFMHPIYQQLEIVNKCTIKEIQLMSFQLGFAITWYSSAHNPTLPWFVPIAVS